MTPESAPILAPPVVKPPKRLQVYFHPKVNAAQQLADEMTRHLRKLGADVEAVPVGDDEAVARLPEQDMIAVIGGDGSMLRSGIMAAPHNVPVLGINYGRLGFLAEVQPDEWKGAVARILVGDYWLEERMMLHTEHRRGEEFLDSFEVLNETVISRGTTARPVRLRTLIDGDELTTYVADGLLVGTATGSTAYAMALGGPILPPELKNILIIPIAPHLSLERAIVLSHGAMLDIFVRTEHQAILNADGRIEISLQDGDQISICMSKHATHFVRVQDPVYFYRSLTSRMTHNPSADKAK
ncbi:MAG: NAD(+)/NADH kinase [Pyrinomonadaceae bacterium]